jgi:hypothetical protein
MVEVQTLSCSEYNIPSADMCTVGFRLAFQWISVTGSFQHDNEPTACTKGSKFLGQDHDHQLLMNVLDFKLSPCSESCV